MIKADAKPINYAITYLLSDGFIAVPWVFGGFRAPVWVSLLLVGLLIVEILVVWDTIQAESRRQAAARTPNEYWLARPDLSFVPADDLPLLCTVTQRPGWRVYLGVTVFVFITVVAWLDLFWPAQASDYLFLGVSMGLTLVCSLLYVLFEFQQVVADEEGLTVRTPYRHQRLRWQEARLLAIAATAFPGDPPGDYELSSATQIVRWMRKRKPLPLNQHSSAVPEEMDVLLALISSRTGLPLLDLRRPLVR